MDSFRSTVDSTGALPISRQIIVCINTLKSAAGTIGFTLQECAWIAETLCGNLTKKETAIFATLMFQKVNSGRYSLSFRQRLIDIVDSGSKEDLVNLARESPEVLFPELYDNPLLDDAEYKIVQDMFTLEWNAMQTLLTRGEDLENFGKYFTFCQESKVEVSTPSGTEGLYSQCFSDVCVFSRRGGNYIDEAQGRMPSANVYVPVHTSEGIDKYCFDQLQIVEMLARGENANPETGEPFSDNILGLLQSKFDKEVKMFRRFLEA